MTGPLLYDKPTAAAQLSISVRVLERLIEEGAVATVRIGRRVLVAADELAAYVERIKRSA